MTTTPEQLQASREKFCTAFNIRLWELPPSGNFSSLGLGREWAGYLRCCQETEQSIKDARKQALEDAIAICKSFEGGGINGILGARVCASRIQELLK